MTIESRKPPRSMKEDRLSEVRMKDCHALLSKIRLWWNKSNLTSRKRWHKIRDTIRSCPDSSVGLDAVVILFSQHGRKEQCGFGVKLDCV